jgi:hypothetical protein
MDGVDQAFHMAPNEIVQGCQVWIGRGSPVLRPSRSPKNLAGERLKKPREPSITEVRTSAFLHASEGLYCYYVTCLATFSSHIDTANVESQQRCVQDSAMGRSEPPYENV